MYGYSDRELRAIARKVLNTMQVTHDRRASLEAGRRMVRRELPAGYDTWDVVIAALELAAPMRLAGQVAAR